jgi:imidazolonepropionase-like amidohydrolase
MTFIRATTLSIAIGLGAACVLPHAVRGAEPDEVIVLKAARMFDAVSGTLRHDATIVVRGERIVAIGGSAPVPTSAHVVDLGDATLLPGFIDAHVHIAYEFDADYYRHNWNLLTRHTSEQALHSSVFARRTLEAGFTTIRNVGATGDYIDVGVRNAINAGVIPGPRMLIAVHAISATGGSCDQWPFPPDRMPPRTAIDGTCNGSDQCREAVRYQIKYGADLIKLCVSGGVLSADPVDNPQFTRNEVEAMVAEAHAWNRKVAAHAHGDVAARLAVEAGVDSIEHGSFLSADTLKLMKRKGVYLVPTRMALYWVEKQAQTYPPSIAAKARTAAAAHRDMFRTAVRLGVPIALGTDQTVMPGGHGSNALEFTLMTELGMSPSAALLAGTRDGARLLGVDKEVGTLEAGKHADIVAVRGDVLANIRATEHPVLVMQRGRIVKSDIQGE